MWCRLLVQRRRGHVAVVDGNEQGEVEDIVAEGEVDVL